MTVLLYIMLYDIAAALSSASVQWKPNGSASSLTVAEKRLRSSASTQASLEHSWRKVLNHSASPQYILEGRG